MKTAFIALLTVFILIFSSCFKSVQKGEADDIIKAFIYEKDEISYLICHESLFQVTSKSSENGVNYTTGWNDTRISVYNIETGQLITREEFGELTEDDEEQILGLTEDHIWLYSVDEDKGLYAVDPISLEIIIKQDDIFNVNPSLKDKLAKPEYYRINQFYGFDDKKQKLIITDDQALMYTIDPVSLKAKRETEEIRIPVNNFDDYFQQFRISRKSRWDFENPEEFHDYERNLIEISLDGDKRKTISVNNQTINPQISFLEGKFISVPDKETENNQKYLQTDDNTYFIAHRSSVNKDAKLIISCVEINVPESSGEINEKRISVSIKWELEFNELFFNFNEADDTSDFKKVFSKGDPEFDFKFFCISDSKLVMIYGLHALGIDTESGNIIWKFKI